MCADPVVDIAVSELIVHENYEPESISQENDIALVRLARPITYTDYIKPICLPISKSLRNKNYENSNYLVVIGYGPDNNGNFINVSYFLQLKIEHCIFQHPNRARS